MPSRAKKPAHERNNPNHSHSQGLAAPGRPIPRHRTSLPDFNNSSSSVNLDSDSDSIIHNVTNGLQHSSSCSSANGQQSQSGLESKEGSCEKSVHETADNIAEMGSTQSHQLPCTRRRTTSASSNNDIEAHGIHTISSQEIVMPASRANGTAINKPVVNKRMNLATASTILSACPMWDVIAILILLLQLPPTIISVIHGLFAVMTFVPRSATFSFGNLPSLHELMAVDPAGAPSMQTVLVMDIILAIFFFGSGLSVQSVLLELAQVVIAISLGGAAASHGRATSSLITCLSIIALSHISRFSSAHQFGMSFPHSTLSGGLPAFDGSKHLGFMSLSVRGTLGAHILAQGILKGVRRYLSSSKTRYELQSIIKKSDGDLPGSSNSSILRTTSTSPESNPESGLHSTGDGRPPGLPPNGLGTDKVMNIKKKNKKQATQVRVQQPFWAAIASTKVTVAKEYELSKPNQDAQEAHAVNPSELGNINFANSCDRAWVVDVGSTEVSMYVSLLHDLENPSSTKREWHVKINGAPYPTTKKLKQENHGDDGSEIWEATVYGLTPSTSYHCLVLTDDDDCLHETVLFTQPMPSTESVTSIPANSSLQAPLPTTMLRHTFHQTELDAEKSRHNLRSTRKQHKTSLEKLQSQIDRENSKMSSTGGSDERQRQRAKQLDNSITKFKAEAQEIQNKLNELGDIPTDQRQKYNKAKDEAKSRRKKMESKKSVSEKAKRDSDKLVATAKTEIDNVLHKRGRFESRQKEYSSKLAEITRRKDQACHAKDLRIKRQQADAASRRNMIVHLQSYQAETERIIADDIQAHTAVQQELKQYQEWNDDWNNLTGNSESPELHAPTLPFILGPSSAGSNSLPGTRPNSLHVSSNGFSPSFTFPQAASGHNPASYRGIKSHRRRASSLEANTLSESQHNSGNGPSLHSPHTNVGLIAPPGFTTFSPASSSALLANSTALDRDMPLKRPSPFPNFTSHGIKSTPTPVGAEKMEGRRKGSGGSGHSLRGHAAGSDSGSPKISNGNIGSGLRNGMVSPPGSAIMETDGHR